MKHQCSSCSLLPDYRANVNSCLRAFSYAFSAMIKCEPRSTLPSLGCCHQAFVHSNEKINLHNTLRNILVQINLYTTQYGLLVIMTSLGLEQSFVPICYCNITFEYKLMMISLLNILIQFCSQCYLTLKVCKSS